MNIFVLHEDPEIAAKMHCDKHVVKMILESAQMLCTALHHYGLTAPYKPTHKNHPCTIWTRQSSKNFMWIWRLMKALNEEFMFRYGKSAPHLSWLKMCNNPIPMKSIAFPSRDLTPFTQAMPEKYRQDDAVQAYRSYYLGEKSHILKYTNREIPDWIEG